MGLEGEGSGGEREGSGVKGGGKWGLGTPLSTPSIMKNFFCAIKQKERGRVWLCVRVW